MSSSSTAQRSPKSKETESCAAIVFSIAGQTLALPIASVLRVLPAPHALSMHSETQTFEFNIEQALLEQLQTAAIAYVEDKPIPVLNLQPCLSLLQAEMNASQSTQPGQFLLLTSIQGQQYVIPVDDAPTLTEIPLDAIQTLPVSYRQSIQGIASHVAVMTAAETQSVVLLLDLQQAINSYTSEKTRSI